MGFERILVANRGEIAVRIIRAAKSLGISTVAVFSETDRDALHVKLADRAVSIGESEAGKSYLNIEKIIDAAKKTGASAIHPGYGFLSENAEFAKACEEAGIAFIGPKAEVISLLGNKREARKLAESVGVSPVPGYHVTGEEDASELLRRAKELGFPLLVKAAGGGGGRGIRIVEDEGSLKDALTSARNEARSAFGSDELILEKKIPNARHVEVQILADRLGHAAHLGERECSVQRRYQKLIEESPSPAVDESLREKLGEAAIKIAKAAGYTGAGTVEFLVDREGNFYFLEMNTRLQVEHPVTEMVTGMDLVAEQIRIAEGKALSFSQESVSFAGHAIEARLYAEDPTAGFLPQTGKIILWHPPSAENIRVDHGLKNGDVISPYYDHLLAKIIAWGETREEALRKLRKALEECVLMGIKTNKNFLRRILSMNQFLTGDYDTSLLERYEHEDNPPAEERALPLGVALLHRNNIESLHVPRELADWSNSGPPVSEYTIVSGPNRMKARITPVEFGYYQIEFGTSKKKVKILDVSHDASTCELDGMRLKFRHAVDELGRLHLHLEGWDFVLEDSTYHLAKSGGEETGEGRFLAEMDASVVAIHVEEGQKVEKGEVLVTLESMKIEFQVKSKAKGTVKSVHVKAGEQVYSGQLLLELTIDKQTS